MAVTRARRRAAANGGNQLPAETKVAGAQEGDGKASEAQGVDQAPLDDRAGDSQPQRAGGDQASDDEAEQGAVLLPGARFRLVRISAEPFRANML